MYHGYTTVIPVWEANVQERTGRDEHNKTAKLNTALVVNLTVWLRKLCFLFNKIVVKDENNWSYRNLLEEYLFQSTF